MNNLFKYFLNLSGGYLILSTTYAFADCEFAIINYTSATVTARAGFYAKIESTILVKPATTTLLHLKSDYGCNAVSRIGTGLAYISFPKDPNSTGVNYSPIDDSLNFLGKFSGDASGRPLSADDGTPLWLNAAGHPVTAAQIEIKLNFSSRPNSRVSGTP